MQIAALSPKYVSTADVSEEYKAHEKEILMAQIQNDPKMAGKPEKVIEGAVNGRLNKELKEVCLLEQVYVKSRGRQTDRCSVSGSGSKRNNANLTVKDSFVSKPAKVSRRRWKISQQKLQLSLVDHGAF